MVDEWVVAFLAVPLLAWYCLIASWAIDRHVVAEERFRRALERMSAPDDTITVRVCDKTGQVVGHLFCSRRPQPPT